MAPNPDLIINIDPGEAGSETIRTVVLPWSGQSIPVRIPPGMTDGAILQLPGLGPATAPGGPPRDAYVQVRIVPGAAGPVPPAAPSGPGAPTSASPFGATPPTAPLGAVPPTSTPPTTSFGAVPPASAPPTAQYGAVPPTSGPPTAPFGPYPPAAPPPARGSGKGKILAIVGGAVAVVLLVVLAVPVVFWVSRDSGGAPSNQAGTAPAGADPSPSATPISPQEYQTLLTAVDKSVDDAFAKLREAKNPKAVGTAVDGIEAAVEEQIAALSKITPPPNVATAHADLLSGLEALVDSLAETGSAAGAGEVCVGSSALARLSRESSAEEVRAAQQALATADPAQPYQVGSLVPEKTSDSNRRLSNGKFLKRTKSGLGQLKIENGGSSDSVINLVRSGSKSPMVSVYVRAKGKFTVTGVRDGTYRIYMTGGKDWDGKAKAFSRDCSFQRFEDTFKFTTTSTQYTIWTITLTPTVGGNARTSDVDPSSFPGS
ncbi:hypothetical protein [Micromonospora sp. HM5-17]|jgi:hypothetical protein|uniref:hypothetical protein n=1 Tax=Micromonospora sp. HM5-17 TaxID=2487710 RepID=UPI000F498FC3|nr:hypothetical protein [Micromonospora sp. HM5-17]ROT33292.1 hypothetical protein EF879_09380 [Micromonospora sp. HM5-17]